MYFMSKPFLRTNFLFHINPLFKCLELYICCLYRNEKCKRTHMRTLKTQQQSLCDMCTLLANVKKKSYTFIVSSIMISLPFVYVCAYIVCFKLRITLVCGIFFSYSIVFILDNIFCLSFIEKKFKICSNLL